jgi:hypothetical protein
MADDDLLDASVTINEVTTFSYLIFVLPAVDWTGAGADDAGDNTFNAADSGAHTC